MLFISADQLRKKGIVGMNYRNIALIGRQNPRQLFPIVDNKLNTKKAAIAMNIPVPTLLAVVERQRQLRDLESLLKPFTSFVIKPARGSGGKGILVINHKDYDYFVKNNGSKLQLKDIRRHINNIISGLYSLGGKPDVAMIEAVIEYDPVFNDYTYEGVPDLRIIVYRGFPVMAMLRCSTHASDGRANLHQGAIGVGIDIKTGKSLFAVQHSKPVSHHPDTGKAFSHLDIPFWNDILTLTAGCFEMTGLGYLGCDIVIDKQRGPMILELNARPGLAIQLANGMGLKQALARVDGLSAEQLEMTAEQRVGWLMATEDL